MNRRILLQGAVLAGAPLAMPASAAERGPAGALAERFAATLSAHYIPAFGALFADDYVNHQVSAAAPAAPGKPAKQGTIELFAARLVGIPDLAVAVEQMVASGDRVAASFVYTGTHGGSYMGAAPTGRALRFTSCDIFRVANGHIVEHWGMGDIAGILAQLRG